MEYDYAAHRALHLASQGMSRRIFDAIDVDKNGEITREEYREFVARQTKRAASSVGLLSVN